MPLTVLTDHVAIRAAIEVQVVADPVRNTVFATMGLTLEDSAWAAVAGDQLAVRSTADRPVNITAWHDHDELRAALAGLPDLAGVSGPGPDVEAVAGVLGSDPRRERQCLFRLDELAPPTGVIGRAVVADATHRDRPVAMACRRPVLSGCARTGPVHTPPEHRGHGYGSAVTAAATRSILADGGIPLLFTDLGNPTSNKIYALLGYRPVEDRLVAFRRPAG